MGVYISCMEMPNKKNGAVLIIYPDGKCAFEDGKTYQAVPVPPHGRLIDADALLERIGFEARHYVVKDDFDRGRVVAWNNVIHAIREYAHTIIPADKEEEA